MLSFQAPKAWGAAERIETEGLFYSFKAHMRLTAKKYMCQKTPSKNAVPQGEA